MRLRIGQGYDIHALVPGAGLSLGGGDPVRARPGWSDADVLLHALGDALLGTAGLGILEVSAGPRMAEREQCHFWPASWSSCAGAGFAVINCDIALLAEARGSHRIVADSPAHRRPGHRGRRWVSMTTNEGLGSIGRGRGWPPWRSSCRGTVGAAC